MRNFRLDDESGHQEALFSWAAYRTEIMPELQYMYHVPNGGKRDKATAAVLKRQGVKAGVPDIMLPAARAGYHGLYMAAAFSNVAAGLREESEAAEND